MTKSQFDQLLVRLLAASISVMIVLIPFHAILTVWLSQFLGHYIILRLWKELLLVPLVLGASYIFIINNHLRRQFLSSPLVWLIAVYIAVQLLWGVVAWKLHRVSLEALGYGWISDMRFLVFGLVVWIIATRNSWLERASSGLVIWSAVIVIAFGLMQYFLLPYDFLRHIGYGANTIFPYQDINHNIHYIRIMSTLRGANPLGAYLVVVLGLVLVWWYRQRSWWLVLLALGGVIALFLTFSRGAWLGLGLSLAVLLGVRLQAQVRRLAIGIALIGVLMLGMGFVVLRHNPAFQNIFFHTQAHSAIATNSDQGHASALHGGLYDIFREPLGQGPGTAGPASVYNTLGPARIAEDYFIQIGQETGWLGLALFVAINLWLGHMLWSRRDQPLALGLLASLVGISFVNLVSHAWADDTLAYMWWGMAGIALAFNTVQTKREGQLPITALLGFWNQRGGVDGR